LLSEIFHQGKLVQKLQHFGVASVEDLGTCNGRVLFGVTLGSMKIILKIAVITSQQDLQTNLNQTAYLDDFPPISNEDPPEVLAHFISQYFKENGVAIQWDMIPDHPELPWKAARKRKVSSEVPKIETQKPAKKQKPSKPAISEVLKGIVDLDTS